MVLFNNRAKIMQSIVFNFKNCYKQLRYLFIIRFIMSSSGKIKVILFTWYLLNFVNLIKNKNKKFIIIVFLRHVFPLRFVLDLKLS